MRRRKMTMVDMLATGLVWHRHEYNTVNKCKCEVFYLNDFLTTEQKTELTDKYTYIEFYVRQSEYAPERKSSILVMYNRIISNVYK